MKFKDISNLEKAARKSKLESLRMGISFIFLLGVMLYTKLSGLGGEHGLMLAIAAVIGAYMAMNIGANDVANNVGPSVGSRAITMGGALLIAALFEAGGVLIAGGDVVATIQDGIVDPAGIADSHTFVWLMMAALLASALWLNIATAVGAPVSTTHAIVGAVLGGGIAAAGWEVVNWHTVGNITMSWIISPVLGGIVAAALLYFIKRYITYQTDMLAAAVKIVPFLVALMAWAFIAYLMLKGLKKVWPVSVEFALGSGFLAGLAVFLFLRPMLKRRMGQYENSKEGVNQFFTVPLIFSAALLSFAHGSNDVANAVGPLAAIANSLVGSAEITDNVEIPIWIMAIGALGISLGLALFGPKLIRTVGSEITELDKMSAYCIAMSSALTVIIASQLGLPVSSTHIAVGGVFGVGFLREYLKASYDRMEDEIRACHSDSEEDLAAANAFLVSFKAAPLKQKGIMLKELKMRSRLKMDSVNFSKPTRKSMKKIYRRELVKRSQLKKIVAAWVITVPASALMSAGVFSLLVEIMG